jgi:diguanylate cyclase (GGDEF)-like protein
MLAALEYQATMRRDFSHRMELRQLAERDGLTGVYNRRVHELALANLWRQALADKVPLVALMVDIDFFKSYNDWFGHPRGDACLKRIATALESLARRPGDFCARYGGEEFCILYYGAAESCATVLADTVRDAVRACAIPHPGSSVAAVVTVSVGAVACRPRQGIGPSDLIEKADAALYAAKRGGRDRTVVEIL